MLIDARAPGGGRTARHVTLTREGVTRSAWAATLSRVRDWQPDQFAQFLDAAMDREGIPNDAELSRRSGVRQTQIGNWRAGKNRPSPQLLDRLAETLRVPASNLYTLAGWSPSDIVQHFEAPPPLPPELRDLIRIYLDADTVDEHKAWIVAQAGMIVQAVEAMARPAPARTRRVS